MVTREELADVPFIYDASVGVGVVRGGDRTGRVRHHLEIVERTEEDAHVIVVRTDGESGLRFTVTEDDVEYTDTTIRVRVPVLEFHVGPVYVRKVKAFLRGNVPTPDIAGETLLAPPGTESYRHRDGEPRP